MGRMILNLPRLGETMEEARVTTWLVAPDTAFKRGDILLEVETDKTVVEVPALQDGVMVAHLVNAGETVFLEAPIAEIETAGETAIVKGPVVGTPVVAAPTTVSVTPAAGQLATEKPTTDKIAASPAARAVARQLGVPLQGLAGTGRNGRVTAADVQNGGNNKAAMVLLHGLYDNNRGWRDLPKRLASAGYEVANIDLPGHGDLLPAAQNFEDAVQIITQHIRETLSGQNIIIIGHSVGAALGAYVAAELQKQRANSVAGLIMLAPAGLGARINSDFIDGMLAVATRASLKNCLSLLGAGPMSDASLDVELLRLLRHRPMVSALAQSTSANGFQQIDIAPILKTLKTRVMAVFGLKDQIIEWQNCAALPHNTAVHFLAETGHLPHATAPEFILQLASNFNAETNTAN